VDKEESIIELRKQLLTEQEKLARIIEIAKKELENAPEGKLRIGMSQGCKQYYHCTKETSHNGIYIPRKETDLARRLAQKDYNKKVIKYAETTYSQITRLLKNYQDDKLEQIFYGENPEKQKLIVPVEETNEQKLRKWLSQPYTGKEFAENAPIITTDKGLRVRSKSERFMANYFDSLGIQYKYECPLFLKPYGTIYPDFTFLSMKTLKEMYWEHEGMMDNPEYARSAVKKIELYEKNGIIPGDNLILTFETSVSILDRNTLDLFIQKYL